MDNDVVIALVSTAGVVLSGIIGSYTTIYIQNKNKERNEALSETPLVEHIAHSNITEYIRMVENMDIIGVNLGRQLLTKDFLIKKFEHWKVPIYEFAEKVDNCSSTCTKSCIECNMIYRYAMKMFEDGMEYERLRYLSNLSDEDQISTKIFKTKFIMWHEDRVERFKKKLYDVCMVNDTYRTCNQKGSRILEALDDALYDTIKDARFTISRLNGELNNKKYKGYIL